MEVSECTARNELQNDGAVGVALRGAEWQKVGGGQAEAPGTEQRNGSGNREGQRSVAACGREQSDPAEKNVEE